MYSTLFQSSNIKISPCQGFEFLFSGNQILLSNANTPIHHEKVPFDNTICLHVLPN